MKSNNPTTKINEIAKHILGTKRAKDCEDIIMNERIESDSKGKHSFEKRNLGTYLNKDIIKIYLQNLNENQINIEVIYNNNKNKKRVVLKAQKTFNKYKIEHFGPGKKTWEKVIKEIIKKGEKEGTYIFKSSKRNLFDKILEPLI